MEPAPAQRTQRDPVPFEPTLQRQWITRTWVTEVMIYNSETMRFANVLQSAKCFYLNLEVPCELFLEDCGTKLGPLISGLAPLASLPVWSDWTPSAGGEAEELISWGGGGWLCVWEGIKLCDQYTAVVKVKGLALEGEKPEFEFRCCCLVTMWSPQTSISYSIK